MQMNNVSILSENFTGSSDSVLLAITQFLSELKITHKENTEFHLVHALVFSKEMAEEEVQKINRGLGQVYKSCGFDVLGGDTSTGSELSVFISTMVF